MRYKETNRIPLACIDIYIYIVIVIDAQIYIILFQEKKKKRVKNEIKKQTLILVSRLIDN